MRRLVISDEEQRFRSLVESVRDWIWEVDAAGVYTYSSPAVEDLLGYRPEEVIGRTPFDLMPPDEAKRITAEFKKIVSEEKPFEHLENTNIAKDGRLVVLETSGTPIIDEYGRLSGYRGVDRDITERKQAQTDLERQRTNLYAMVTHDIKSPLGVILGYSELILEDSSRILDPEVKEKVIEIFNSANKLKGLVEDFLSISKLEAGKIVIQPVPSDISYILEEACKDWGKGIRKKGLDLRVLTADSLPAKVLIDPKLVQRALSNLLLNALNYTPAGGTITLGVGRMVNNDEDAIVFTVSDTGYGIPIEEQEIVFEKYYRSPKTARIRGTGLGLAIVKAVAETHGGRVELDSEVGKGSTFRLILPIASKPEL